MDDHDLPSRRPMSTHEVHPAVRAALQPLLLVLADPDGSRVALDLVDEVAEVVSDLIDTHPPMPPLEYPASGTDDDEHALRLVRDAITHLEVATEVSRDAKERLRSAVAVRQLRCLCSRPRP